MGLGHSPRIVTDGLVLCLDAASKRSYPGTGTTWTDLKGDNNGSFVNMTSSNFSSDGGGSLTFDGTNERVTSSSFPAFGNSARTLEVWFKSSGSSDRIPVSLSMAAQSTVNVAFAMSFLTDGTARVYGGTGTYDETGISISKNLIDGSWHHAVLTWDEQNPGTLLFYGDGDLVATRTRSTNEAYNTSSGCIIGTWYDYNRFWSGNISTVKIYSKALSPDEVRQNYLATKERYA
jgi:hypothetical protein